MYINSGLKAAATCTLYMLLLDACWLVKFGSKGGLKHVKEKKKFMKYIVPVTSKNIHFLELLKTFVVTLSMLRIKKKFLPADLHLMPTEPEVWLIKY